MLVNVLETWGLETEEQNHCQWWWQRQACQREARQLRGDSGN
jgi:hypothetical protein